MKGLHISWTMDPVERLSNTSLKYQSEFGRFDSFRKHSEFHFSEFLNLVTEIFQRRSKFNLVILKHLFLAGTRTVTLAFNIEKESKTWYGNVTAVEKEMWIKIASGVLTVQMKHKIKAIFQMAELLNTIFVILTFLS